MAALLGMARIGAAEIFKRVPVGFLALWLFWALEVFLVQEYTLFPPYVVATHKLIIGKTIRLMLTLAGTGFLLFVFSRKGIYMLFALWTIAGMGLLTYFQYYSQPLSALVMLTTIREAAAVTDYILILVMRAPLPIMVFTMIAKTVMVRMFGVAVLPRRLRAALSGFFLCCYLTLVLSLNVFFPLSSMRGHVPHSALGMAYGYVGSWMGEIYYLSGSTLLERALEAAPRGTNRLASIPVIPLERHVVVLQVESLDYDLLHLSIDGTPVMPFLNSILDRSIVCRIHPTMKHGSADADFVFLMAMMHSPDMVNYKIRGFPFEDSLARLATSRNFSSIAINCMDGSFYGYDRAYPQMGFDRVFFYPDVPKCVSSPSNGWLGAKDGDVLRFSGDLIRAASVPTMHFILTNTTHGPFDRLQPEEMELFDKPTSMFQNYVNSFRYFDSVLAAYYERLPASTTLVVYGDHGSGVVIPASYGGRPDGFVPFIIHSKKRDLGPSALPAFSMPDLTLLDFARYIRRCFFELPFQDGPAGGHGGGTASYSHFVSVTP